MEAPLSRELGQHRVRRPGGHVRARCAAARGVQAPLDMCVLSFAYSMFRLIVSRVSDYLCVQIRIHKGLGTDTRLLVATTARRGSKPGRSEIMCLPSRARGMSDLGAMSTSTSDSVAAACPAFVSIQTLLRVHCTCSCDMRLPKFITLTCSRAVLPFKKRTRSRKSLSARCRGRTREDLYMYCVNRNSHQARGPIHNNSCATAVRTF